MKRYMNTIFISAILLIIFPFLGLPELWENIYVSLLAFIIGYSLLLLRHRSSLGKEEGEGKTLQDHIQEIKHRFDEHRHHRDERSSKLSDISLHEDDEN